MEETRETRRNGRVGDIQESHPRGLSRLGTRSHFASKCPASRVELLQEGTRGDCIGSCGNEEFGPSVGSLQEVNGSLRLGIDESWIKGLFADVGRDEGTTQG